MSLDNLFVRGAERLKQRIETIRTRLALPALTNEIGELLLRRTLDRFDRAVDPDGRPWKPLSPATLRRKSAAGYAGKGSLKRTETLRKSIRIIKSNAGATFINTGAGARIGVTGEAEARARVHQYGSRTVPARRFLGVGALDVKSTDSFLRRRAAALEQDL